MKYTLTELPNWPIMWDHLTDRVPDHSTFSVNQHSHFCDSDILRTDFEEVVCACMGAGLDGKVMPYSIRRGMATLLRKRGISEWELQGWLGHRRPGSTEHYASFSPSYLIESRSLIDAIMQDVDAAAKRQVIVTVDTPLRASG